MKEEVVDIVDENDKVISIMSRQESDKKDVRRRSSRVLIFDKKGNILVHKRALTKSRYPGYYDVGIAETLTSGEEYDSAAARGLKEEVGIKDNATFLFYFKTDIPVNKRNYNVYKCVTETVITADPKEVTEARFVSLYELKKMFKTERFTPTGRMALEEYLNRTGEKMNSEYLTIVDEDDNVIGKATYDELKAKGLIHRAANVFVFNSKGEMFVHRRAESLNLYPGTWDVKFGGHVRTGESYEEAALREMNEEAGISGAKLSYLFPQKSRRPENLTNRKVFQCTYDGKIVLDKAEVAEGKFMKVEEAIKLMEDGKLSPSAEQVFEEFLKRAKK